MPHADPVPTNPLIDAEKLATVTALYSGGHSPGEQMCVMEAVAYVASEPWSDRPQCVSPTIAALLRSLNDSMPDAVRTDILLPLIPTLVGTVTTEADERTRAYACADSAARIFAPAALRACGMEGAAAELEALPEIIDEASASHARTRLSAAYAAHAADAAAHAAYAAHAADAADAAAHAADAAAHAAAHAAHAADAAADAAAWTDIAPHITSLVQRLVGVGKPIQV